MEKIGGTLGVAVLLSVLFSTLGGIDRKLLLAARRSGENREGASLQAIDDLEEGEVMVCEMTLPPWVPLFSIAGAVVCAIAWRFPGTESFAYGGTGRVAAGVVDVGIGRPADYAGKDVAGKIVRGIIA